MPAPSNNLQSLRHFYDKMETYIRGLESVGQYQDTYGSLLVPIVLDKLSGEIRENLAREYGDSNWKLDDLRRAINREINIIEAGVPRNQPDIEAYGSTASFFAGAKSKPRQSNRSDSVESSAQPKPPVQCAFCDGLYVAVNCQKYADAESRIAVVKRNKLCFNCLGRHQVSAYKSKRKCQKCHRKHHTSIYQTPLANQQQNNFTTDAQTLTNGAAILHASTPQSPAGVLLKTAIATMSSSHTHCEAPISFDDGAQRSFITASLASELQLPVDGTETVCLSTFGGNNNVIQHLETASVFVMTDSNQKIPIRVLIAPSIATPIDNRKLQAVRDLPYLLGLKLAHSVTRDTAFTISLLIDADHYWEIVEDEIIRWKGPTAIRSKIGYLLSGPVSDAPS